MSRLLTSFALLTLSGCQSSITIGGVSDASGDEPDTAQKIETCIAPLTATSIAAGDRHACAVSNGRVYCWGYGDSGQLGGGRTEMQPRPRAISSLETFKRVAAMALGTCAVGTDDWLYCWGNNFSGGLADGGSQSSAVPVSMIGKVYELVGGQSFMVTRDFQGVLTVWGSNHYGQLGLGPDYFEQDVRTETLVPGSTYDLLAAGASHACVTDETGLAYCAGDNISHQLGLPSGTGSDVFTLVTNALRFQDIDAGQDTTCGITSLSGQLYCWGDNTPAFISGEDSVLSMPMQFLGLDRFEQVSVGFDSICVIRDGGRLFCWGNGEHRALGQPDEVDYEIPMEVTPGTMYDAVTVGSQFACAIRRTDNVVVCFGENDVGQLGRGTDTSNAPGVVCMD